MKGKYASLVLIGLAGINLLIPYGVLRNVSGFHGNYLFWSLLTLAVIVYAAVYMRNWGKK